MSPPVKVIPHCTFEACLNPDGTVRVTATQRLQPETSYWAIAAIETAFNGALLPALEVEARRLLGVRGEADDDGKLHVQLPPTTETPAPGKRKKSTGGGRRKKPTTVTPVPPPLLVEPTPTTEPPRSPLEFLSDFSDSDEQQGGDEKDEDWPVKV